jgi:prepilin-type N-terminal cleavage/methylation domain-containing protein
MLRRIRVGWALPTVRLHRSRLVGSAHPTLRGFTLVEMLVAMAITLVMMGAVVTLFANISNSVRNRRATIEMSAQLRHVRNVLQQDLQGATCPGITWQRPESNHGYIEIIEGPYKEGYATNLIDADPNDKSTWPPTVLNPEIDHTTSTIPSSNLAFKDATWATDGGGLGDYDDILMLTSRNEHEPFVGRIPAGLDAKNGFKGWTSETIQSPLAEVVWFAMENPGYTDASFTDPDPTGKHFFGEPGMRTIYRRTLLIAPWVNPYLPYANTTTGLVTIQGGFKFKPVPGLLRMLPSNITVADAIASVIAFQDRYDVSVRPEWDQNIQRWKIMANTLGDLTKRENRFGHFFYRPVPSKGNARPVGREYPYAMVSTGSGYSGNSASVQFLTDPDPNLTPATTAIATANLNSGTVVSYTVTVPGTLYPVRPFAFVSADSTTIATAQAMLNDDGSVVRLVCGPVPLWGSRRGEDVMMTNALAFDLRVYDPGAPMFASRKVPGSTTNFDLDVVLTPSDPGWRGSAPGGAGGAYFDNNDHMRTNGSGLIGTDNKNFQYVGQGAYVDMGYGYDKDFLVGPSPGSPFFPAPKYASGFASSADPWFFKPIALSDVYGTPLAPGYAVYDTWSFHYENNGVNENQYGFNGAKWVTVNTTIDEGTNGLDDVGNYYDPTTGKIVQDTRLGIDDIGERETAPPYDKPLRGMQVLIRSYERDSRSIRQVRVNQHFMQE